ncbi:uncharacterized protein RCC_06749 [Ramularia collo-cygni]|uniref:Uncharacterized protein n=1 Tax=Ramularia collo-cygni TaxID=112498 RepID=A0A2D3VG92_9PEZI|nr:uncharacterized protein RCC_06749 [Ramularia collo-cygni]CZT20889.1 uncharacterized protein RCC_06749 [Ramularia collo-cygni]
MGDSPASRTTTCCPSVFHAACDESTTACCKAPTKSVTSSSATMAHNSNCQSPKQPQKHSIPRHEAAPPTPSNPTIPSIPQSSNAPLIPSTKRPFCILPVSVKLVG